MYRTLSAKLVDPETGQALRLEATECSPDGDVLSGRLLAAGGRSYLITGGIPRFVQTLESGQRQTAESFGYKWTRWGAGDVSTAGQALYRDWLLQKYGFTDEDAARSYFKGRSAVLEVGCGMGMSSSLTRCGLGEGSRQQWVAADLSAAIDVARGRLGTSPNSHFVQADLMQLPFRLGSFDTIFTEGVLHHTPSTEAALKALIPHLAPGGDLLFYVYRKKGPVREFSDDCIRDLVSGLPPEKAWEMLLPLTRLGQALAKLRAEVDVPEDIPYLGIKAGKQDVQRLIYWSFLKLFWNDQYSFEENQHINFDWYHPGYAHRQTEEEVLRWCSEAGLTIHYFHTQESGFTVRATRN